MYERWQPVGGQDTQVLTDPPATPDGSTVGISCASLQSEAKVFSRMLLRGLCKLGTTDELQRTVKERCSHFSEGLERLRLLQA